MDDLTLPEIKKLALDVSSDENVDEVVKTIIANEEKIDVLVNNAGLNCAGQLFGVLRLSLAKIYCRCHS